MAALFGSMLSVHARDLALENVEGSLSDIRLLKGEGSPKRLGYYLQSECTLTPCLGEPEGRDPVVGEGEVDGTERGEVGAENDDMVPGLVGVENEGGAPKSA
ncbi:Uncharacterized protein Rs2_35779 [Raphanus sativus]|nr:Uncharacterized protein Rs2_35779 [Raphanus sativus]